MVLPTNISIRLTSNVPILSILQATHWLLQQQQMHLLHMMLTLIHRLIPSTDSELRGNVQLQRHMSLRCLCHRLYWRGYAQSRWSVRPVTSTFYSFLHSGDQIKWSYNIASHFAASGCSHYRGRMAEGCCTARTRGRCLGPRWLNRKVEKMAQWAWVIG